MLPELAFAPQRWNPSSRADRRALRGARVTEGSVFLVEDVLDGASPSMWEDLAEVVKELSTLVFLLASRDPAVSSAMLNTYLGGEVCSNVIHGGVVIDQRSADACLRSLDSMVTPCFVLASPLSGHVDLGMPRAADIAWVIASGNVALNSPPIHPLWVRSLRNQCLLNDVAFRFEGWGAWMENVIEVEGGETLLRVPRCAMPDLTAVHVSGRTALNMSNPFDPFGEGGSTAHGGWTMMRRVGALTSGRVLDRRVWDEAPMRDVSY